MGSRTVGLRRKVFSLHRPDRDLGPLLPLTPPDTSGGVPESRVGGQGASVQTEGGRVRSGRPTEARTADTTEKAEGSSETSARVPGR